MEEESVFYTLTPSPNLPLGIYLDHFGVGTYHDR